MVTICIGGHGRCDENDQKQLPAGVSLHWYGQQGYSVTKSFSAAVLDKSLSEIGSTDGGQYSEHYLCPTAETEAVLRAEHFQRGTWDNETFLIQAKPAIVTSPESGFFVKLSQLLEYAQKRWNRSPVVVRWAVCRSSVRQGTGLKCEYTPGQGVHLTPSSKFETKEASAVPQEGSIITAINENNVWLTKWSGQMPRPKNKYAVVPMPKSSF